MTHNLGSPSSTTGATTVWTLFGFSKDLRGGNRHCGSTPTVREVTSCVGSAFPVEEASQSGLLSRKDTSPLQKLTRASRGLSGCGDDFTMNWRIADGEVREISKRSLHVRLTICGFSDDLR